MLTYGDGEFKRSVCIDWISPWLHLAQGKVRLVKSSVDEVEEQLKLPRV